MGVSGTWPAITKEAVDRALRDLGGVDSVPWVRDMTFPVVSDGEALRIAAALLNEDYFWRSEMADGGRIVTPLEIAGIAAQLRAKFMEALDEMVKQLLSPPKQP